MGLLEHILEDKPGLIILFSWVLILCLVSLLRTDQQRVYSNILWLVEMQRTGARFAFDWPAHFIKAELSLIVWLVFIRFAFFDKRT